MPLKTVRVRDHQRHRPRSSGLTHVDKYTREQITGSRQYDLEESLGPQHDILSKNDPEGEVCARCGWQRPVHQRDISGQPICRECHDSHYQGQIERRVEHQKRDRAIAQRLNEWERWQQGNPTIRRSGAGCQGRK